MQDLEELKREIKISTQFRGNRYFLRDDEALELIARCESAEKDRDDWKSLCGVVQKSETELMLEVIQFRKELKELREQSLQNELNDNDECHDYGWMGGWNAGLRGDDKAVQEVKARRLARSKKVAQSRDRHYPVCQVLSIKPMESTATISWSPILNGHCPFDVGSNLYLVTGTPQPNANAHSEQA